MSSLYEFIMCKSSVVDRSYSESMNSVMFSVV